MPRNYKLEYERYHKSPEQKKRRAARNKIRRQLLSSGRVRKGSRVDVHHRDGNPENNSPGNITLQDRSKNRSFARNSKSQKK
jgi:hypothetical protein